MSRKLEGKVAIVLGAAGRDNMGQVIAKRFADEGARVVVAGRHLDELNRFAATIGGAARTCDITKKSEVELLPRRMGVSRLPSPCAKPTPGM